MRKTADPESQVVKYWSFGLVYDSYDLKKDSKIKSLPPNLSTAPLT